MTSRLPAASRRSQLVEVAIDAFGETGFHDTSMNDVAKGAGVTKPVLYQHFKSKEDLFGAVLEHVGVQIRGLIEEAALGENLSAKDRVKAGFIAYYSFLKDHRASARILFGEARRADESTAAEANKAVDSIAQFAAALIDVEGLDDQTKQILATGIVGIAEGAGRQWVKGGHEMSAEELAEVTAELAWSGLQGLGQE